MTGNCRAVSTVADVTLALLLIVAAMGVIVGFDGLSKTDDNPIETEYTAETITASTMNVSYTLEPAIREHYQTHIGVSHADTDVRDSLPPAGHNSGSSDAETPSRPRGAENSHERPYEEIPYEDDELQRASHGPVVSHIVDIVLTRVEFQDNQLSKAATDYGRVVEETLVSRLVEASHQTNIQAFWWPVEGIEVRGDIKLGPTPPSNADVSSTTVTVPSGLSEVRFEAIDAVEDDDDFESVAQVVASAVIQGYVPTLESQRALEGSGVEFDMTVYRYLRLATVIGNVEPSDLQDAGWLAPPTADASAATQFLSHKLAEQLEDQLSQTFDTAHEAARAVSTGDVTITIRTWANE